MLGAAMRFPLAGAALDASWLAALLAAARAAGAAIMTVYEAGAQAAATQTKADASPVTAADLAAHAVLAPALQALWPGCPVVSEEDVASHPLRNSNAPFWLIDPLDGTKEFLARNGQFTVNIALIDQGRSVFGVVYAPALQALYWGGPELGAWMLAGEQPTPQALRPALHPEPTGVACRVVASQNHLNAETQAFIEALRQRYAGVSLVQAGSSLKFCRLAEGQADVYPRLAPTCEWDTAAAQAVLEGAGGCVQTLDGAPLRYGKPQQVLNPSFVAARSAAWLSQSGG